MVNIKRGSQQHIALQYLKMKKDFVSVKQLYDLSPTKFYRPSRAMFYLDKLVQNKLAIKKNSCYAITQEGNQALRLIVRDQPAKSYEKEL